MLRKFSAILKSQLMKAMDREILLSEDALYSKCALRGDMFPVYVYIKIKTLLTLCLTVI